MADVGDVARFPDRNHFASWTGTAPLDASSGDQIRHRLPRAGNRRLNHVLHIAAIVQIRHDTEGRTYYRRKRADGKKPIEAMRCLKRRISDAVYRQLVADAERATPLSATKSPGHGPGRARRGGHGGRPRERNAWLVSMRTVAAGAVTGAVSASCHRPRPAGRPVRRWRTAGGRSRHRRPSAQGRT